MSYRTVRCPQHPRRLRRVGYVAAHVGEGPDAQNDTGVLGWMSWCGAARPLVAEASLPLASPTSVGPAAARAPAPTAGPLRAPAAGRIAQLHVAVGDVVAAGQVLAVLEAMKVELPVRAPAAGRVVDVRCQEGGWAEGATVLLVLAPILPQDCLPMPSKG